ncbi:ATP-dependent protease subunit HslV [bacterium]|nr:ATP-dependent protease subunit HslV [bacterium]MBL7052149.1 ATP-dependent protease subunit HslV [Candidatus Neomarinimicrobiota bacterium]
MKKIQSTTILAVRSGKKIAIGGDGQVTFGDTVLKGKAVKIRKLFDGRVLAGFAGASADAFALFEKFEAKLEEFSGNLPRAAVELAKEWRMDKVLRQLEAMLIVADVKNMLLISGDGNVIEPDKNILAIGSGGPYAQSAAEALISHTKLDAAQIVKEAMKIAAHTCIYTNKKIKILELK